MTNASKKRQGSPVGNRLSRWNSTTRQIKCEYCAFCNFSKLNLLRIGGALGRPSPTYLMIHRCNCFLLSNLSIGQMDGGWGDDWTQSLTPFIVDRHPANRVDTSAKTHSQCHWQWEDIWLMGNINQPATGYIFPVALYLVRLSSALMSSLTFSSMSQLRPSKIS